ncbi:MAG: DUF4416 family protein [Chloroflexi bacterium]|nr:DUF4416 family protein [Chloroflexota bacterium]
MGTINKPIPVKLIIPMLSGSTEILAAAQSQLIERIGPLDYVSPDLPFDYTDYYTAELGQHILRRIVAVRPHIDPGDLAGIKILTNDLEDTFRREGRRTVNLDPGYLCGGKLVLASTKDQAHRIYIGQGIFAEVTLMFRHGAFVPLPWTYPDYASDGYLAVLSQIRGIYMSQLRAVRRPSPSLNDQADV